MPKNDAPTFNLEKAPTYANLYGSVEYSGEHTLDQNIQGHIAIFDRIKVNPAQCLKCINENHSYFTIQTGDTRADRRARKELSERAREVVARRAVTRKFVNKENAEEAEKNNRGNEKQGSFANKPRTIKTTPRPWASFFRDDNTEEAKEFNNRLLSLLENRQTEALRDLIYGEFERRLALSGITSPDNIVDMYYMDDAALVQRYEQIQPFFRFMSECENPGVIFTEEQQKKFNQYKSTGLDGMAIFESRMNTIANPHYEYIDPKNFNNYKETNEISSALLMGINDEVPEKMQETMNNLSHYVQSISDYHFHCCVALMDIARQKYPELKGAVLGYGGGNRKNTAAELTETNMVAAHTTNGKTMIIRSGTPLECMPSKDFAAFLEETAKSADKWLFTGSKQFADMQKALAALTKYQKDEATPDTEKLNKLTETLQTAAKAYLQYKGVSTHDIQNAGKNAREHSRIDVAEKIFLYASAQSSALTGVMEAEREKAENALGVKGVAPPKISDVYSEKNIENFFERINKKATEKEQPNLNIIDGASLSKSEYGVLCALACGSPEIKIAYGANTNGTVTKKEMQNEPDTFYARAVRDLLYLQNPQYEKGRTASLLRAAPQYVTTALTEAAAGNFEKLGKLIADGIKQNNKLLQGQKGFSDAFTAFAKIGQIALEIADKIPGLKEAVNKNLPEEERVAVKAGVALSDLRIEGIQSRENLTRSLASNNRYESSKEELANICQMEFVNMQLAKNTLDLKESEYGKIEGLAKRFNQENLKKDTYTRFLYRNGFDTLKSAINNPLKMAKLQFDCIKETAPVAVNKSGAHQINNQIKDGDERASQVKAPFES